MAAVLSAPIEISSNEDLSERFVFQTDDGEPLSLNGYTATFGLRKASRGPTDLSATSADDEVIIDANAVVILIPSERLEALAPGSYSFEVKLTDPNGIRIVKVRGTVNLKDGIAP